MLRHAILGLLLLSTALVAPGCPGPEGQNGVPEEVIRHNILGTAYLGQQKWAEAEAEFRKASDLRPQDPLPLNNAAVALIQQGNTGAATEALEAALTVDPQNPYAHYNLGLILRNDGKFDEAARHLQVVADFDPDDLLTQYHLASVLARIDRNDEAESAFRKALERDPTHVSTLYGLGRFLLQHGQAEEGADLIARSQEIRSRSGLDTAVGSQYGEQGPYAMGIDYAGDALAAPHAIPVVFRPAAADGTAAGAQVRSWTLARTGAGRGGEFIFAGGGEIRRLTAAGAEVVVGTLGGATIESMAAGDIDNDDKIELVVLANGAGNPALAVLETDGEGWFWQESGAFTGDLGFEDGGMPTGFDMALVDREHDGDLDLFACWASAERTACLFATNDGKGRFAISGGADHGVAPQGAGPGAVLVSISDADNDRDIDLLLAQPSGMHLYLNQRDGTFADASAAVGIAGIAGTTSLEVADVNKDGWMDLVVGGTGGLRLLVNRRGKFDASMAPLAEGDGVAAVLDLDNDGFLDLVHAGEAGLAAYRNLGSGTWKQLEDAMPDSPTGSAGLAALDADGDGDLDLVADVAGKEPTLLTNEGGNGNGWIEVESVGVGDNRFGIGTKVEILAGALRQKFEVTGPLPIHAGLGSRAKVESVRYLWPSGVLQDEVEQQARESVVVTQLDRKGTSCPLLYAWRDDGWEFVTDFLGGAAIGYRQAPDRFGTPDTDEYVKIPQGLTPDTSGRLRLRLNNQLEEVIWFDQAELIVVDHPLGTEVFPNERLMPGPPFPPFELFVSDDLRPIRAARGVEDGADLSLLLREADGRFVANFAKLPFKGYAEPHTLELDLGPFPEDERVVLLMDGWIDYADSSSNVAAHQAGATLVPPRLLVADGRGGFSGTGHLMGFPAGLPKTLAVELSGLFPSADHRIRIETTMRIYWDRARILVGGQGIEPQVRRLKPLSAELRFGGFPRPLGPAGPTPLAYDPDRVSFRSSWKAHAGAYTAFGDVADLVKVIDDRFVTTRNGDEIELSFQAPPPPAPGQVRSYLLFADGFGKDMDPNSAAADEVGPQPFHGMAGYPYSGPRAISVAGDDRGTRLVLPSPRGWPGALPQALAAQSEQPKE